jgi:hypothetical protein
MMNSEALIENLVQLCKSNKYALLFFEEFMSMSHSKGNIDVDRRRRNIGIKKGVNIKTQEAAEFFKQLEKLKLGKYIPTTEWSKNNNKFEWTYLENPIHLAGLIIQRFKSGKGNAVTLSKKSSHEAPMMSGGQIYIFTTELGQTIKLTQGDIDKIKTL